MSLTDTLPPKVEYGMNVFLETLPLWLLQWRAQGFCYEAGVKVKTPSRLSLGQHVTIQRGSLLHCGGKAWCNYKGKIVLLDHVVIGPGCILYGAGEITVGAYSHLGPGAMIIAQGGIIDGPNRLTPTPDRVHEPVTIGPGCWIGAGAVILGNTTLGDSCTVGPNSVVKGHYEAGTTLIGNPARVSRHIPQGA